MRIFRHIFYEFFLVQHLLTFLGFVIAIMYHLPLETAPSVRTYIWIAIGLYCADRLTRSVCYLYNNIRPGRAILTALPNGITKVSIKNGHIRKWRPGAFVLLSIPRFGLGQSHPATIASVPTSSEGDMVFFLRAHRGFTQRLAAQAKSDIPTQVGLPARHGTADVSVESQGERTYLALIDGPYSGVRVDFGTFDTTILIAASTGVTFTLPILLDLAHRTSLEQGRLPLRKVIFTHIVKDPSGKDLVCSEVHSAITALCNLGVDATAQTYVTCEYVATGPSLDDTCTCRDPDGGKGGCDRTFANGPPKGKGRKFEDCALKASGAALVHEKHKASVQQNDPRSTSPYSRGIGISLHTGRPNTKAILADALNVAEGEMGVAVCGPLELSHRVRKDVASLTLENLGGPGIFLHAENFEW